MSSAELGLGLSSVELIAELRQVVRCVEQFTEARIGAKPRAVVVAKPPEGVVFASFRADVFFGPRHAIPLCISGTLFVVFGGFEGVALGHHWDVIWRALRANLRSIKDFNANPKYYAQ